MIKSSLRRRISFSICCVLLITSLISLMSTYLGYKVVKATMLNNTGVEYFVQAVNRHGANAQNAIEDIYIDGLVLPDNQSTTSRALNDPRDVGGQTSILPADTSGKYWGQYHEDSMNWWYYNSQVVTNPDWYQSAQPETVFSTALYGHTSVRNGEIVYKFQMDDSTTNYNIVVGANSSSVAGIWNYQNRSTAVHVNGENNPSAVMNNLAYNNICEIRDVKAVENDAETGLENMITLSFKNPQGTDAGMQPFVSFIIVTKSDAQSPLLIDGIDSLISVGLNDDLPQTVALWSTSGLFEYAIDYTDRTEFDKSSNKILFGTVTVKGNVTVGGQVKEIQVPVQFIEDKNLAYYIDTNNHADVTTAPSPKVQNSFNAIKEKNTRLINNNIDKVSIGDGDWGHVSVVGEVLNTYNTQSNLDPYKSTKQNETADADNQRVITYRFSDLAEGDYTLYVGGRSPDDWAGWWGVRETNVSLNGKSDIIGKYNSHGGESVLYIFDFKKETPATEDIELSFFNTDALMLGLVAIAYGYPNYGGTDENQEYFLDCANASTNIGFNDIGLSKNQSVAFKYFNEPNKGAIIADKTRKNWGAYFDTDMGEGYYESYGATSSPFTGILAAKDNDRNLMFKFQMEDDKTDYDIIIGSYCIWGGGNGDARAGNIHINNQEKATQYFANQSSRKINYIQNVKAQALDDATNLNNIITVEIKSAVENSNPLISFISIRKSSAPKVYLSDCNSVIGIKQGGQLPQVGNSVKVMTTKGMDDAEIIEYSNTDSFENSKKILLESFEIDTKLKYDNKVYNATVQVTYILEDVYYYANMTLPNEQNIFYTATQTQLAFDAMKNNNPTMINDIPDRFSSSESWGCLNNPSEVTSSWAYDIDPYNSVKYSAAAGSGSIRYNFTELPIGNYLVHVGMYEPWGQRSFDVSANGFKVGNVISKMGEKTVNSFLFKQTADYNRTEINLYGSPLVSFIIIQKIDADSGIDNISFKSYAQSIFYNIGDELNLNGLMIDVEADGISYTAMVDKSMVSGFDSTNSGVKTIKINYGGKELKYQVTVLEDIVQNDDGEIKQLLPLNIMLIIIIGSFALCVGAVIFIILKNKNKGEN